MTTDKKNIQALVEVCRSKGIRQVVFSPGSRSAPLVIAFSQVKDMQCLVIPDERVAGFFALGIAQQQRSPVALVCTSGTAVLNFAPAICEAYYQQVPLLVLTADRPSEYIGIGENQAINQTDIYKNYIRASYTLPEEYTDAANVAAQAMSDMTMHYFGPVHINVPLREPLYGMSDEPLPALSFASNPVPALPKPATMTLSAKNMLICGMHEPDEKLMKVIEVLARRNDFVVVAEAISNLPVAGTISKIDSTITLISENDQTAYAPDTIITIGKQIVSKRLRQFLRKAAPWRHYHISTDKGEWNGLGAKQYIHIAAKDTALLEALCNGTKAPLSEYNRRWAVLKTKTDQLHKQYAAQVPFSDWWVFGKLIETFPADANIQYGNSSPVRYAGMWPHRSGLMVNSNRGTSGIDGCMSTAAGAAFVSQRMTVSIVGDVSFIYDSNALWNNYLSPQLRIIVINNGGGNIFRLIEGPKQVLGFEKFFETAHRHSAEYLAQMYQIPYYFCDRADDMDFVLAQFYKLQKGNKPAILEIRTDSAISEKVYKDYFRYLTNKE